MAILSIKKYSLVSPTKIRIEFSDSVNALINTSNFNIVSNNSSFSNPILYNVKVNKNIVDLTVSPLYSYNIYSLYCLDGNIKFSNINSTLFLPNNNSTNVIKFIGPVDSENQFRTNLIRDLSNNVYSLEDGNLITDTINIIADQINKLYNDIKQTGNEIFLEKIIENEKKVRGIGPTDALNEKGAYKIIKVSKEIEGTVKVKEQEISEMPASPITLQAVTISQEKLISGTSNSTFNGLLLTLAKNNVTKVKTITIKYFNGSTYSYSIESLGYTIKDNRYDQEYASSYQLLESNQVQLSTLLLEDENFTVLTSLDYILITYEYKNVGQTIVEDSVDVYYIEYQSSEVISPIVTTFALKYYPVVDSLGNIIKKDGVSFLDPEANPPFSSTHPAFTTELEFNLESLPKTFGEYTINYETGEVIVYGAIKNDGTGDFPPLATYYYKFSYDNELDYIYDNQNYEVVRSPIRDLEGESVTIACQYYQNLIENEDFIANIHKEVINERIENRLLSNTSLRVQNPGVTNVFRIYNETSGEIYKLDRFNNDKVYFNVNNSPRVEKISQERCSFTTVDNEIVLVQEEYLNANNIKIFEIHLNNSLIISATEDSIGSSFNSSVSFSNSNIFGKEIYFSSAISLDNNIDRLDLNQYQIDYNNGIIYLATDSVDYQLGTVNYKKSFIKTGQDNIISVDKIYSSIDNINIDKVYNFSSYSAFEITFTNLEESDERFDSYGNLYIYDSNTVLVKDDIKSIRGLYDHSDLLTNDSPINFAENCTFDANLIQVNEIFKQEQYTVESGLVININQASVGIDLNSVISVKRISDDTELYTGSSSFVNYQITLDALSGAVAGDEIVVIYGLLPNGSFGVVVDYDRGELFVDYTYLFDEILVTYEYGSDSLDFAQSTTLNTGDEYYVTYKVGSLRDTLFANFGSLIDVNIIKNFNTEVDREIYRSVLQGILQMFPTGPTKEALGNMVKSVTHIFPEIIEAAFEIWSLGYNYLFRNKIKTTGDLQLVPGKFDNGVLVSNSDDSISLPLNSNLKLEQGSLKFWAIPQWDGIDNDAELTLSLYKNDVALDASKIFIGSNSYNPTLKNNSFSISKSENTTGLPAKIFTETGVFIYYDIDNSCWKLYSKDLTSSSSIYTGTIETNGEFYNSKWIPGLKELNDILRTFNNKIEFKFNIDSSDASSPDGYVDGYSLIDGYSPAEGYQVGYSYDGIQFMSDKYHYFFDFGQEKNKNRFSLFKDGSGYLTFKVIDKNSTASTVSYDVSGWKNGEKHFIGLSWRLNSSDNRDEMHMFVDGFEVPNILSYGSRPVSTLTDRFRTVKPEYLLASLEKDILLKNDLTTTAGSNIVTAVTNFSAFNISPGDKIEILDQNLGEFIIGSISGQQLALTTNVPSTITNAKYTINPYSVQVSSQISLYKNIIVSLLRNGEEIELAGLNANTPGYEISQNLFNQDTLKVLGDALTGDQLIIRTLGKNFRRIRENTYLWNSTNLIKTQLPPPINLDEVNIYKIILNKTSIGPTNSTLSLGVFTSNMLTCQQTTNSTEGRTLEVTIVGGNTDFTTPVTVTINGTTNGVPVFETLTFSEAGTQKTALKFKTITGTQVICKPYNTSKNSVVVSIKEAYSVIYPDANTSYPVLRFVYKTQHGTSLQGDGSTTVVDSSGYFIDSNIDQALVITSPGSVAGTYNIESRSDTNTIVLDNPTGTAFTSGIYDIYNISLSRSGFQNGYFYFQTAGGVNENYNLPSGDYLFDYSTYLSLKFDPIRQEQIYIGSDFNKEKQANAVIDELHILDVMLSDVRVGESAKQSFTTDFTKLRPVKKDKNTLLLLNFDEKPFVNKADFWVNSSKQYLQSDFSVNEKFDKCLVINDKPLVIENKGYLTTKSEGTIEFWVSPKYDTGNDPVRRYYFDASSSLSTEIQSTSKATIILPTKIKEILSVKVKNGEVEYSDGATIAADGKTINLKKQLPYQKTNVVVSYIQHGTNGDRLSIFKDSDGFITFYVSASGYEYEVRQPIFWERDSWHRIKATFKFNRKDNKDEIRLFVDGEERGTIRFGQGFLFSESIIFGQGFVGVNNSILIDDINFKDSINEFYIGSDFAKASKSHCRIDNFKISNKAKNGFLIAGQYKDVNYSSNLDIIYPSIEDLYTTYLLDFNKIFEKNTDFTLLHDPYYGIFNFKINIIDSFKVLANDIIAKNMLEAALKAFKPSKSKMTLNYLT
jgi:hypothetical protein